jgi:predicted ATP-binding protein involved in virulence
MIALVADIMSVMQKMWAAMDVAEGIVLIDELGAHLHPRWMMQIIKRLRITFPRVQFLITSHDPLCLRGLFDGEVVVMRRDLNQRVIAITDLPSVEGMRIDQILTSEHFSLDSTIDPELDTLFQEYYYLLALRTRNQKQEKRLGELRQQLEQSKFRVFGSTPRERIMLEEIDKYLAQQRFELDTQLRQKLEGGMRSNLAAMLDNNQLAASLPTESNLTNFEPNNRQSGPDIREEDEGKAGVR